MKSVWRSVFVLSLLTAMVLGVGSSATAQEAGLSTLEKAEAYYEAGQYESAIKLLTPAIGNVELSGDDRWVAYELLAASYIQNKQENDGRRTFVQLLNENDEYAGPDASKYSDLVVSEYSRAREEWEELRRGSQMGGSEKKEGKPFYKNKWFLIGGGIIIVGAVALIASS